MLLWPVGTLVILGLSSPATLLSASSRHDTSSEAVWAQKPQKPCEEMLADRLLANPTYHAEREMQNLELLKTRRQLSRYLKAAAFSAGILRGPSAPDLDMPATSRLRAVFKVNPMS